MNYITPNIDTTMRKLEILTDSAKYDVACTSSGVDRKNTNGLGSAVAAGICHAYSSDGRCVSLLKILLTNDCVYDCKYCVNRRSNDVVRATFTPEEVSDLTIQFYRRNYIEGLFLSSAVIKSPDYTSELLLKTLQLLRYEHKFNGYIHVKAIPGVDPSILHAIGFLADRMSVNIEMPSEESLKLLAPNKPKQSILRPMNQISKTIVQSKNEVAIYKNAPSFVPAGQSTQMIVGATPDTDHKIINLTESLYKKYSLKRVFFSAYVPVSTDKQLPVVSPPLLREHRLYQADWLLRFYNFSASELLSEDNPYFSMLLDPKCDWAIRNLDQFPVEINNADYYTLLRVPGIGVTSAQRIVKARKTAKLDFATLKNIGVVLKRASLFITCNGKMNEVVKFEQDFITNNLVRQKQNLPRHITESQIKFTQISLFDDQVPLISEAR